MKIKDQKTFDIQTICLLAKMCNFVDKKFNTKNKFTKEVGDLQDYLADRYGLDAELDDSKW